jgi:hypothetical protein
MTMRSYHLDSGAGLAGLTIRDHKDPTPVSDRS